jgi:predicted SAM-dependent methyltransferase
MCAIVTNIPQEKLMILEMKCLRSHKCVVAIVSHESSPLYFTTKGGVLMKQLVTRMSRLLRTRHDRVSIPSLDRVYLANQYLSGSGLEIGALHHPLPVPASVRVSYVDRMGEAELRGHYPELQEQHFVPIDIVDNGETLSQVNDASQDFVIANHFLEHCEDPISTLGTFLRVLRPGGIVYLAIPEKTCTFDCDRPVTPLEHFWEDHRSGPHHSRWTHYHEWAELVDKRGDDLEAHAKHLLNKSYSIHFHVWDQSSWLLFLHSMQQTFGFHIEVMLRHGIEIINVLRKIDPK